MFTICQMPIMISVIVHGRTGAQDSITNAHTIGTPPLGALGPRTV